MELEDLMNGRDVAADWLSRSLDPEQSAAGWTLDDDGHVIAEVEPPWIDAYEF